MATRESGNDKKEAGSFKKLQCRHSRRGADKEPIKEELP